MIDCGVIYMAWGENAIAQAKQSIYSLRRFMSKVPILVVGDDATEQGFEDDQTVDIFHCHVDPFNEEQKKGFKFLAGRIKPLLDGISPFEKTLYVDADTYFQRPPTEGFQLLDRWDLALAETQTRTIGEGIAGKEECAATAKELGSELLLYHNSGMIFWQKNERTRALFDLWAEEWQRYQDWDEQVALLRALLRSEVLYLTLPYTWNHSGLSECYMLSHWFGTGDARFDMRQRNRQVRRNWQDSTRAPLVRIELTPGRWVQCRADEQEKVRELYGFKTGGPETERKEKEMRNDNPLVKVSKGRGAYVKMRLKDAKRLGLDYEFEKGQRPPALGTPRREGFPRKEGLRALKGSDPTTQRSSGTGAPQLVKERGPVANKMREPGENKLIADSLKLKEEIASQARNDKMTDFAEISGIGKATDRKLHEHGIHSLEALKAADVSFLPGSARKAVEIWRESVI